MSEQVSEGLDSCPVDVAIGSGFHWRKCGRPIKRNGLCGLHAAARERVARNDDARVAESRRRREAADAIASQHRENEAAIQRVRDLADWFDAQPNWRPWGIGAQIRNALANPTAEETA